MVINKEYSLAYVEVIEILKYLDSRYYNKIPKEKISVYEEYKDKEYKFKYDASKSIESQVKKETKAVLANLFLKYIANEADRQKIYEKDRTYLYELEEQKKNIKLNPLFENKKGMVKDESNQQNQLIKIERQNMIMRIFLKIINFFRRKGL